jgi:SAM-dependent methyltransferase
VTAWYEDDDLWRALEPALFSAERLASAPTEVDRIMKLAKLAPGMRLLDLGTGPGRHALGFARHGLTVTGVDRTRRYLERARAAAAEAGVQVEFVEADMRTFERPGAFDAAVNLFSTFGYFSDAENLTVARKLRASLKSGGVAVLEMMGKEILARDFAPRVWHDVGDILLLEDRIVSADWARVSSRWIIIEKSGARHEHTFELRQYSGVELRDVLLAAGFASVELYGSLDGIPYDVNAKRLVALARA